MRSGRKAAGRLLERLKRSFSEFLAIPVLIVAGFFGLAILLYVFDTDAGSSVHWGPVRSLLSLYVGDGKAASSLLTTIAGSLITVTSITFSILLLAVQQGASALTSQIIDHYLRRPANRAYFGFFVGTSVFALVTLVLTTDQSRPVLGVTFATLFACCALFVLILLIYSTIDQIRPISVISKIHDTALSVRETQFRWLESTAPGPPPVVRGSTIVADRNGYLARVRVDDLSRLIAGHRPGLRIVIVPSVGAFVATGMPLAIVDGAPLNMQLERAVRDALPVEEKRDVGCDAAASVDDLVNIAWTAISTAKSNPAVGTVACNALLDILLRWTGDRSMPQTTKSSLWYHDDADEQLLNGFESLVVVASESMQHQTLAIVMDALSLALLRSPEPARCRIEEILMTSLPALGDHLPTRRLQEGFERAVDALRHTDRADAANKLKAGWGRLSSVRGVIKSRGNRDE